MKPQEETITNNQGLPANSDLLAQAMAEENPDTLTLGERMADRVAEFGGSWTFIISFGLVLLSWIALNTLMLRQEAFDPFPYILLNLLLSCLAAIQAPIIMMSQNRQETKDRTRAKNDYLINLKAEIEVQSLHQKVDILVDQLAVLQEQQRILLQRLTERENLLS
ncbi:DUF1003 domain-containing protein [Nibrella saemangeumensis]|uniref:DUF1003 domain-containing protein n=1 Tax=Nibrella saemangeumensis TaxID=1084526 RepID=A0ABP8MDC0_9BACT